MKKTNKISTILILFSFVLLGAYIGAHKNTINLTNPTTVKAIELDIGQAAKDASVPGTINYNPTDPEAGFGILLGKFLNIVVVIATLLVFMYLIWGGIEWITSSGDKGKLENARNKITQAIIGLIVLASVIAIFMMIQDFLGIEVLTFTNGSATTP